MSADDSVLILYTAPSDDSRASDRGVLEEVNAVREGLDILGVPYRIAGIREIGEAGPVIAGGDERIVFNLVEGFAREPEAAALIPAVCAGLGRACTGSDTACLVLTLDKALSKTVLANAGLPVPPGVLIPPGEPLRMERLPAPPYIVKPVRSDASEGIFARMSVFTEAGPGVQTAVDRIHSEFGQPALVERFVGNRELNLSVLERGGTLHILPPAEIDFSAFAPDSPRVVDYEAKWVPDSFAYRNTPRIIPARIPEGLMRGASDLALSACRALGVSDYARVDMRLDEDGEITILEVNANPDISPEAGFAAALNAAGISPDAFVKTVLENTGRRLKAGCATEAEARKRRPLSPLRIEIRKCEAADRDAIVEIIGKTGAFRPDEEDVAREVLDESLERGTESGYVSSVACVEGRPVGWICYGPVPCTVDAFDLYWIAVDPRLQYAGIGSALMARVEEEIRLLQGRIITADTSGRADYRGTRAFYRKCGYLEEARIRDFYDGGDDKVIFCKRLGGS